MTRKIIHIDMDAFFASIEQRDNPSLRGRPVLVGGKPNSRGVVAAASYEARAFGVFSAMPCARAARLCPKAVFVRPRFNAYQEASQQIREIFLRYTNTIEPLSLDEAYLDVTEACAEQRASELAKVVRQCIFDETQLTASAGISYNKFLAKMASDMRKPNGQFVIPPERGEEFVAQLAIGKFYGVGKATEARMNSLGIRTGADLRRWSLPALQKHFGKWSQFLHDIARGIDERAVDGNGERKSIGAETTFSDNLSDRDQMLEVLLGLSQRLARTLEKKQLAAETITIKARYPNFDTVTRQCRAAPAVRNTRDIEPFLPLLLERTDAVQKSVRLLGLSLSGLSEPESNTPVQLRLKHLDR
ncbi:MAG: DNA polymerase IV [Granulosicoccaceae bacterium]